MKNKILKIVICLSVLSFQFCSAQNLSVKPTSKEAIRISELASQFADSILAETKAIRVIYVDIGIDQNEYYFGLIVDRGMLKANPPSYYFFNPKNEPVVVYTGFEKNIKFSPAYLNEIGELAANYLWPEDVIMTMHFYVWYVKFSNGKEVKFIKQLSKKKQRKIPKLWINHR